jgi:cellulose synthase (UDP-forming)
MPPAEPPGRRVAIHLVAVTAIVVSVVYLSWRAIFTVDLAAWWLSIPLLALEAHAVFGLVLYTLSLWDLDGLQPAPEVTTAPGRVAVLIPTYDEPLEVLLPTVAAAVALEPAHETWVLDDGRRPWVEDLAGRLGARYLTRPDNAHAKAGNINHALTVIDADFAAVLDADHVALPGLLTHTLGYFRDPKLAVVQTPQDFYNVDSFEHVPRRKGRRYSEQALFYRSMQAGRNRWNAAFWCGTNAVLRVAALRDVGGVATSSVTEDIHTTIKMHRRGWKSAYHNEVLARGLAAADAGQYLLQRVRWGTGAMQVLRTENPAWVSGLRPMQRVGYLTTLLGWFDAWRTLGYVLLPLGAILTGAAPIDASLTTFLAWFVPTFLLQRLALLLLGRGLAPQWLSTVFEFVRMPANLAATLTLLGRRSHRFVVTPKGRQGDGRRRLPAPRLLLGLQWLSVLCACWYAATRAGITPLHYSLPWAADASALWLAVNAALLVVAVRRIRAPQFATERRASVRFQAEALARCGDQPVLVHDVSLTGALLSTHGPVLEPGQPCVLTLALPGGTVELASVVRSRRHVAADRYDVGLEYLPDQLEQRAALALTLFRSAGEAPAQPVREAAAA